jgi:FlaA1/EpsC-like NDP-sugar epimerase
MKHLFLFRNRALFLGDLFLIAASALASYVLRLNFGDRLLDFIPQIVFMIVAAWIIKPLVYTQFGLYRRVWVYASVQELKLITIAVTFASVILFVLITLVQFFHVFDEFSRGAVVIDWLLSLVCVGGIRFSFRILAENRASSRSESARNRRILVVGAGSAGSLVVKEMQKNPLGGLYPVCFVDDDPSKQKNEIHGVPVAGKLDDIPRIIEVRHIDEVIIAIPSAPGEVVRKVTELCRQAGVAFRTMPSLHELIGGKVSVNRLREVDITDLLRREPAHLDSSLIGQSLTDRRVLVTGAGGSIGRELCLQIAHWNPAELILLGHGENSIFEAVMELSEVYPGIPICPVIADVRDADRLNHIFDQHHPQVVFHAAAHKHVPLMEANVPEAVANNILGTQNVVQVAAQCGVERLVMISTDKAVRPSSVMGATKRIAELIVLNAALESSRAYSVVRFGNVLGSRGSIVPIFKRQIARGGPVTITHPDMERYFMTIPEAVHLVLQASAMGKGGETYVLNMGKQVKILTLAEDLIRLSGLEPGKDIEIAFTGIRPGEKLSEALWDEGADYQPTAHPDIVTLVGEESLAGKTLRQAVEELSQLSAEGNAEAIITFFDQAIPGCSLGGEAALDVISVV